MWVSILFHHSTFQMFYLHSQVAFPCCNPKRAATLHTSCAYGSWYQTRSPKWDLNRSCNSVNMSHQNPSHEWKLLLVFHGLRWVCSMHLTADRIHVPWAFPPCPKLYNCLFSLQTPTPPFLVAISTFTLHVPWYVETAHFVTLCCRCGSWFPEGIKPWWKNMLASSKMNDFVSSLVHRPMSLDPGSRPRWR